MVHIPAVPAHAEERLDKVVCDLCQKTIKEERYEVDTVVVTYRNGDNYPEGGSGEETSFDVCSDCWKEKLLPWFKEQGASPQCEEWDW